MEPLCRLRASFWSHPRDDGRMDMHHVVAATAKWVRDLEHERFCLHGDNQGVLHLLLDKVAKECRLEGQDWQIPRQVSPTQSHQSMEPLRKPSPQCVDCEKRHTNDPVREDSWTDTQERDPATGWTSSRSPSRSKCQSASAAMGNRPLVGT